MKTLQEKIVENITDNESFLVSKDEYAALRVLDLIRDDVDELAEKRLSDNEFLVEFVKKLKERDAEYSFEGLEAELLEEFIDDAENKRF